MLRRRYIPRPNLTGFSLVEVIAATALLAGTLVPATAVMRQAMQLSREATQRNLLGIYAVRLMEDHCAQAMRDWSNVVSSGNFAADGHADVRYVVTQSDDPTDGGLTNRLMHIHATVYHDANGDAAVSAGELRVDYRTKVSRLLSYENEPT